MPRRPATVSLVFPWKNIGKEAVTTPEKIFCKLMGVSEQYFLESSAFKIKGYQ